MSELNSMQLLKLPKPIRRSNGGRHSPRAVLAVCLIALSPCLAAASFGGEKVILDGSHKTVLKLLGKNASKLPQGQWLLLSGNGLDKNIVVRQLIGSDATYFYVFNPSWWKVDVMLLLSPLPAKGTVRDVLKGIAVPIQSVASPAQADPEKAGRLVFPLAPHGVVAFRAPPKVALKSAETEVEEAARQWIDERLKEIRLFLPRLPTHRPNLIKNGGFEQLNSSGFPVNWHIFNWHRTGSTFLADDSNAFSGKVSLCMDNSPHGRTIGIYSDRINVIPGREYTLSVRMGSNAPNAKAALYLVGSGHYGREFRLDDTYRNYSLVLSRTDSGKVARDYALVVEIHSRAKGRVWVDDVRLVDSTDCSLSDALAAEWALKRIDALLEGEDFLSACRTLTGGVLSKLSTRVAALKHGAEWMVIGPFACPSDTAFKGTLPVETDALKGGDFLAKQYMGLNNMKVKWIHDWATPTANSPAKTAPRQGGYLDLAATIGSFNNSVAYAYTCFISPASQKALLLIGSDDCITVYLNRAKVCTVLKERPARPAQDILPVNLKAGRNEILVKVHNHERDWGFYLTVADEDRRPLRDLGFSPLCGAGN